MEKIKNANQAIEIFMDDLDCNIKQKLYIKCLRDFDESWIFRKNKFKNCEKINQEYIHCLLYSNESKLIDRKNFEVEINKLDTTKKIESAKLENKKDALDFLEGKLSEEEYKKKVQNTDLRKKIIEL